MARRARVPEGESERVSLADEWRAGCLSRVLFEWVSPFIREGARRPLDFDDLGDLRRCDRSALLVDEFDAALAAERARKPEGWSLWRVLFSMNWALMAWAGVCKLIGDLLGFVQPIALNGIVDSVVDGGTEEWGGLGLGWWWAMAMTASSILQNILLHQHHHFVIRAGLQSKSALSVSVYRKALRITPAHRTLMGMGEITNLQATDSNRVNFVFQFIHYIWAAPLQLVLCMVLLYLRLGPSAFVGLAYLVLLVPAQGAVSMAIASATKATLEYTDRRIKMLNEIVGGVRIIKFFGWERFFVQRVEEARHRELQEKRRVAMIDGTNTSITDTGPLITALLTFLTFSYTEDEPLTSAVAFSSLALFNILRLPLFILPMLNNMLTSAFASVERFVRFFNLPDAVQYVEFRPLRDAAGDAAGDGATGERSAPGTTATPATTTATVASGPVGSRRGGAVVFENATFRWAPAELEAELAEKRQKERDAQRQREEAEAKKAGSSGAKTVAEAAPESFMTPTPSSAPTAWELRNLNLVFPAGSLTTIVGEVGSGKSAIIHALLGEMHLSEGRVTVELPPDSLSPSSGSGVEGGVGGGVTRIAYCAQQAWILNATVKKNILFGQPFDEAKYEHVIHVCCLREDLRALPAGDRTEIGEKGINLSGGQKARVALARAVYSNAPVVVLDDVLSAVDAHVARRLFHDVIRGELRGKTVIFTSHQLQFLPQSDHIVVLQRGRVVQNGTYASLMAEEGGSANGANLLRSMFAAREDAGGSSSSPAASSGPRTDVVSASPSASPTDSGVGSGGAASSDAVVLEEGEGATPVDGSNGTPTAAAAAAGGGGGGGGGGGAAVASTAHPAADASAEPKTSPNPSGAESAKDGAKDSKDAKDAKAKTGKLVEVEHRETGSVKSEVYFQYIAAGGAFISAVLLFLVLVVSVILVMKDWWLSRWSEDEYSQTLGFYLGIYGAFNVGSALFMILYQILWAVASTWVSLELHSRMFLRILRAPTSWYDRTPAGRIQNRFTSDVDTLDKQIPTTFSGYLKLVFTILSSLATQAVIFPWILIGYAPIAVMYYFVHAYYRHTSREVKRMDNVTKSPVFSHFSETLSGLTSLRAYGHEERFTAELERRIDANFAPFWRYNVINRWLGVRLDTIGGLLIACTSFAAVGTSGKVDPGLMGLSLSYALFVTGNLNWLIRSTTDLETQMSCVERIVEYATTVPQEKAPVVADQRPAHNWPTEGAITFRNVSMRYQEHMPLVLKGVDIAIRPMEKIGVCGRTGSGKSSLMQTLFRMVEPEAGGSIRIDGVETLTMGLDDLRSHLAIIPQDPLLFSGSVRYNLDPTGASTSEQMWDALRHVQLEEAVQQLGGLDGEIEEGGANLSVGQRQLVCIARAILRRSKVLVLDEATASVDVMTDAVIQRMIRDVFRQCTVLTIAHRINTIADSDRILVLDAGNVVEFGAPAELLARPDSHFAHLVEESRRAEGSHGQ